MCDKTFCTTCVGYIWDMHPERYPELEPGFPKSDRFMSLFLALKAQKAIEDKIKYFYSH